MQDIAQKTKSLKEQRLERDRPVAIKILAMLEDLLTRPQRVDGQTMFDFTEIQQFIDAIHKRPSTGGGFIRKTLLLAMIKDQKTYMRKQLDLEV